MSVSRKQAQAIADKYGIELASPDDPIYKQPPSVTFTNRSGGSTRPTPETSSSGPSKPGARSGSSSKSASSAPRDAQLERDLTSLPPGKRRRISGGSDS